MIPNFNDFKFDTIITSGNLKFGIWNLKSLLEDIRLNNETISKSEVTSSSVLSRTIQYLFFAPQRYD